MLHPTENTVDLRPATKERLVAPNFSSGFEAIARGGEALGQGIRDVGDAADKIGETYDEAAVRQADAEDLKQVADIRGKVMSSKGFDTQTALEQARNDLQSVRKTRMASLHNNRQRLMYGEVFDRRNAALEESFTTHSLTQIAAANQDAATARADSAADFAVDTYGSPGFDENMGTALNSIAAANQGAAPEVINRKQQQLRSSILSRAISGMLADPDQADHAKLALEQHATEILPEDEEKLHRMLNPILEENQTDADAGRAFAPNVGTGPVAESAAPSGQVTPGNINLHNRPVVKNADGSISTVKSMSIGTDKGEVLIPMVVNGKVVSKEAAIAHYKKTGENLGTFKDVASANAYAESLHEEQAQEYGAVGIANGKPIMPADPLRGKGQITDNAAAHRARGSGNALDIAAPAGTPIYTPMEGKVVKSWFDPKGGWSVLVEHPNGYVTGYAHMRTQSPYKEGQQVDPTTAIGSVGATGDATGPHVHYTVRQSRGGPKVDPSQVLWDSKGTVNPDSVSWKNTPLQKYSVEENGLQRALDNLHTIATKENWGQHRYQKAVERVRQISGVQNQLYDQQQTARYNDALSTVVNLGDKFTSISQIPNFGLLKPSEQYSFQNIAKGNREGGVKANGDRYLLLMGMAQSPEYRSQFLGVDLGAETGITPGERAKLLSDQIKLKQEPDGALAASLGKAEFFANRYLPKKNFDEDQRRKFSDRFMAAVERQQTELGRQLTDKEMDEVARSQTVQVVRSSGGTVRGFELQGTGTGGTINIPQTYAKIPIEVRNQIEQELIQRGQPHSQRDVVGTWLNSRSR